MSLRYLLLCVGLLYSSSNVFTQTNKSILLKGTVYDSATKEALVGVNISLENTERGTTTDSDGQFRLRVKEFPTGIYFSYLGYELHYIWVEQEPKESLSIALEVVSSNLPEAVISAQPIIEEITEKTYTVKDFEFFFDKILLLRTVGTFETNELVLMDFDGNELVRTPIIELQNVQSLHKSCMGGYHLLGSTWCYELLVNEVEIELRDRYSYDKFEKVIQPCVTASQDYLYYQNYDKKYLDQILSYDAYARNSDDKFSIQLVDELNVFRFFDEIGRMNGEMRPEEKDGWIHLFYQPLNAPLFNTGRALCLFDHVKGIIYEYTYSGRQVRNTTIDYHQDRKWGKVVFFDRMTGTAYTTFDHPKGKALCTIDLETGKLGYPWIIDCLYIEKMKVHNNHLFYLESGLLTTQRNRILHKVKLP